MRCLHLQFAVRVISGFANARARLVVRTRPSRRLILSRWRYQLGTKQPSRQRFSPHSTSPTATRWNDCHNHWPQSFTAIRCAGRSCATGSLSRRSSRVRRYADALRSIRRASWITMLATGITESGRGRPASERAQAWSVLCHAPRRSRPWRARPAPPANRHPMPATPVNRRAARGYQPGAGNLIILFFNRLAPDNHHKTSVPTLRNDRASMQRQVRIDTVDPSISGQKPFSLQQSRRSQIRALRETPNATDRSS